MPPSHSTQRFNERIGPGIAIRYDQGVAALKVAPGHYYKPVVIDGVLHGYAAYKTVGKDNKLVLTTFLGKDMKPKGNELVGYKLGAYAALQQLKLADLANTLEDINKWLPLEPAVVATGAAYGAYANQHEEDPDEYAGSVLDSAKDARDILNGLRTL